jgi:hypothetical protein
MTPALQKPISQQSTPAVIETELDGDLTPGDPPPVLGSRTEHIPPLVCL